MSSSTESSVTATTVPSSCLLPSSARWEWLALVLGKKIAKGLARFVVGLRIGKILVGHERVTASSKEGAIQDNIQCLSVSPRNLPAVLTAENRLRQCPRRSRSFIFLSSRVDSSRRGICFSVLFLHLRKLSARPLLVWCPVLAPAQEHSHVRSSFWRTPLLGHDLNARCCF